MIMAEKICKAHIIVSSEKYSRNLSKMLEGKLWLCNETVKENSAWAYGRRFGKIEFEDDYGD